MSCPGLHCPGCSGPGVAIAPVVAGGLIAYGVYDVITSHAFLAAFDQLVLLAFIAICVVTVGTFAGLVLVLRARPVVREAPRPVLRAYAEQIGREPVHVVTTAPERGELEPARVMTAGELAGAHEPARARVLRARRGAGVGPGRLGRYRHTTEPRPREGSPAGALLLAEPGPSEGRERAGLVRGG